VSQRYTYTGREKSAVSGAPMYYRYRMYQPGVGRFGGRDPAGYANSALGNLYKYVHNRPTTLVDPMGLGEQAEWAREHVEEQKQKEREEARRRRREELREKGLTDRETPIPQSFTANVPEYMDICPEKIRLTGVPDYTRVWRITGARCKLTKQYDTSETGDWNRTSTIRWREDPLGYLSKVGDLSVGQITGGTMPGVSSTSVWRGVEMKVRRYKQRLFWRDIGAKLEGLCMICCKEDTNSRRQWAWIPIETNDFKDWQEDWRDVPGSAYWRTYAQSQWLPPGPIPDLGEGPFRGMMWNPNSRFRHRAQQ
jgi:RHS repeat-associated protein